MTDTIEEKKERARLKYKEWYYKNHEYILAYKAKHRIDNPETYKKSLEKWLANNPDKYKKMMKDYRSQNKHKIKEAYTQWRQENIEWSKHYHALRWQFRNAPNWKEILAHEKLAWKLKQEKALSND